MAADPRKTGPDGGDLAAVERHATVVSVRAPCYIGVEALRLWLSDIHIACGLALPLLILVHVLVGRRTG